MSDEDEDYEGPDDADIPSNTSPEDRALCPLTNEPFFESSKAFEFKGFVGLTGWKTMAKRNMTAAEYADALQASELGEDPAILDGFIGKSGKKFSAGIKPDMEFKDEKTGEVSPKWVFWFEPDKASEHKCPKSGEPVMIGSNRYTFPGYPDVGFFRQMGYRDMSVPDFLELIEAGKEGVMFRGFKGKKGNYDARLVFNEEKGKIEFDFGEPKKAAAPAGGADDAAESED